ncbi:DDE-type integrase/transposase/recombinase, partial [Sphingobacterium multivorum]
KDPRRIHLESQFSYLFSELRRVGVTRQLLWQEYIIEYPDGFGYSRFCELLQEHIRKQGATMRFEHEPGKLLQVDFAGDMLHYVDTDSGELIACPVLVAVLPFSGYSYVEALINASLPQVLRALNNALGYFGGVPLSVKSDNMKQWVVRSNRYEPKFADMLEQWANHNNIALLATRPAKPRDKASVEGAVKITYQRIYAPLRNETFK